MILPPPIFHLFPARLGGARLWLLCAAITLAITLGGIDRAEARYASIVVESGSGRVLHETNADTRNYPASLTKMMTLYLLFDALESGALRPDSQLKVSNRAAGMQPSKLGLAAGTHLSAEDAIYALVTKSANDAAVVVAEALGGTEVKFARLMTKRGKELGMTRTTFRNASGLPNRGQLSTARDMAVLSHALLTNHAKRYAYFATRSWKWNGKRFRNHNRLLEKLAGTDGIKTGYIRASGFNVAASTVRDGVRLITVVFGGKTGASRDAHAARLTERAFARLGAGETTRHAAGGILTADEVAGALAKVRAARGSQETRGASPAPALATAASPAAPALVATTTTVAPHTPLGAWGIQIGAFSTARRAEMALAIAMAQVPALLTHALPGLEAAPSLSLVRARFLNLDKLRAFESCRRLRAGGLDCLILAAPN